MHDVHRCGTGDRYGSGARVTRRRYILSDDLEIYVFVRFRAQPAKAAALEEALRATSWAIVLLAAAMAIARLT